MAVVKKIVSGGQTGVDRAAIDVAIFLGLEHGGWCPLGRRAEDGVIPLTYQLQETTTKNYAARTIRNVLDSDGTLVLYRQSISGGTGLTCNKANQYDRPLLCLDLSEEPDQELRWEHHCSALKNWLQQKNIQVLNVAGPRESTQPGIAKQTEHFLLAALQADDFDGLDET